MTSLVIYEEAGKRLVQLQGLTATDSPQMYFSIQLDGNLSRLTVNRHVQIWDADRRS